GENAPDSGDFIETHSLGPAGVLSMEEAEQLLLKESIFPEEISQVFYQAVVGLPEIVWWRCLKEHRTAGRRTLSEHPKEFVKSQFPPDVYVRGYAMKPICPQIVNIPPEAVKVEAQLLDLQNQPVEGGLEGNSV